MPLNRAHREARRSLFSVLAGHWNLCPRHHTTALCIHNSLSGTHGRGFGYGSNVSWLLG